MINESDLYTWAFSAPLQDKNSDVYGHLSARYEVRRVTDVRNMQEIRAYRLTCTQRIVIPNRMGFVMEPHELNAPNYLTRYDNYPAMLKSSFVPSCGWAKSMQLLDYSPRTLNSTITAAATHATDQGLASSRQHMSGSSMSETNTYGFSASMGAGFGTDFGHSSTSERNKSATIGSDQSSSTQSSESDGMSVKDWASYAYLDANNTTPTWVWAQEYPWDIIQFFNTVPATDGSTLGFPPSIGKRLFEWDMKVGKYGEIFVFPPSQLSRFGIDFTMKAAWLIQLPERINQTDVVVGHAAEYLTASHGTWVPDGASPTGYAKINDKVSFDFSTVTWPSFSVTTLGLDPIRDGSADNGAVIGFIPSKFISGRLTGPNEDFKIISDANTLEAYGIGFCFDSDSTIMQAGENAKITVRFKIVDGSHDYTLFMKHWVMNRAGATPESGCTLTFTFNGNYSITRRIQWGEGEGGEDNLSSIVMRNKDYTTIDYHDYLVMGLNTITIEVAPDLRTTYYLRALAIGEA